MKTPLVISLDDTPIRVSEINFPSVTICPGLCPLVKQVNYKTFVTAIKSGKMSPSNFTKTQ